MFDNDRIIHQCFSCDAEFTLEAVSNEEEPSFCPYCGSELDYEEELDDELDDYDDDIRN